MGDNETTSANPPKWFGFPLIVAWALSPAVLIAVTCSVLGVGGIHQESPEFPAAQLNAAYIAMFLILYPLLVWQISKVGIGLTQSLVVAIPFTIVGMLASFIIAFAGCGVVEGIRHFT